MTEITPYNILRHELIGLSARVVRAKNRALIGARGTVIDESRNMLTLDDNSARIRIPKDVAIFVFRLPNGTLVEVDGARLVTRPESRLKAKVRRW